VRLVHGSPRKVNEYLFETKPPRTFERIAAGADCDVLFFGHTHQPWIREYGGVLFVNCGSVGKPKDGDFRAAFALLELEGDRVAAHIERVQYDALLRDHRDLRRGAPHASRPNFRNRTNSDQSESLRPSTDGRPWGERPAMSAAV
jgi:diadenosine tetraphosphatase ApaH/serine/threonine PP2A family protein phosphatase